MTLRGGSIRACASAARRSGPSNFYARAVVRQCSIPQLCTSSLPLTSVTPDGTPSSTTPRTAHRNGSGNSPSLRKRRRDVHLARRVYDDRDHPLRVRTLPYVHMYTSVLAPEERVARRPGTGARRYVVRDDGGQLTRGEQGAEAGGRGRMRAPRTRLLLLKKTGTAGSVAVGRLEGGACKRLADESILSA